MKRNSEREVRIKTDSGKRETGEGRGEKEEGETSELKTVGLGCGCCEPPPGRGGCVGGISGIVILRSPYSHTHAAMLVSLG